MEFASICKPLLTHRCVHLGTLSVSLSYPAETRLRLALRGYTYRFAPLGAMLAANGLHLCVHQSCGNQLKVTKIPLFVKKSHAYL
jgi:hypothetical protein